MNHSEQFGRQAAFASALKALDQAPKKIRAAREQYSDAVKANNTPEVKRNFSEAYREKAESSAKAKRDAEIKKQVEEIRSALQIVRENRNGPDTQLDVNNSKLLNALNLINTMGKNLDPSDQISIAEQFRGDPASLRYLVGVYKKNGYYYADLVQHMTDSIPQAAIDDMQYNVSRYDYTGTWDDSSDSHIYWTKGEFAKAYERYGFGDSDSDPYESALYALKHQYGANADAQHAIGYAIEQLRKHPDMTAAERADIFNSATETINAEASRRDSMQNKVDAAMFKAQQNARSAYSSNDARE